MAHKEPTLPASEFSGKDHSIDYAVVDCVQGAKCWIEQGYEVFQKFTCEHCGQRLNVHTPNVFYDAATCDQCGGLTDIKSVGCNFVAIKPGDPR